MARRGTPGGARSSERERGLRAGGQSWPDRAVVGYFQQRLQNFFGVDLCAIGARGGDNTTNKTRTFEAALSPAI